MPEKSISGHQIYRFESPLVLIQSMGRYCPSTFSSTLQRIQSLGCDQRYRYHCLRNKKDEMLEKCMEISWIQEGKCAVFDTDAQQIDAWKCNNTRGICPKKQYLSNEVMSYSACVNVPDKSSLAPTTFVKGTITTTSVLSKSSNGKGLFGDTSVVVGIGVGLVILVVFVVGLILYKCRKRACQDSRSTAYFVKDGGNALSDFEGKENTPLTTSTVSNENYPEPREQKNYDDYPYYTTKTYEYIENLVENSSVGILIVGEPGSGKSVLAGMLYERFRLGNDTHCTSKLLENLNKIDEQQRFKNSKMIFIIDDCFEDWIQYPHLVSTSLEQLQSVHQSVVEDEGNCLVLTISKNNFESNLDAVQKLKFKDINIIDLSSKDFSLDITDRTGILEYHRKKKRLTTARMEDKSLCKVTGAIALYSRESDLEFEFPLSCQLFYLHDSFEAKQEVFFIGTKATVVEFVRGLRNGSEVEKCQYCTLMYAVLCGGQVQTLKTDGKVLLKDIARAAGIDTTQVKLEFNYGCCLITEGRDSTYKIVHEEITKLLFASFGTVHPRLVLEKSNYDALLKFVRTDDTKRRVRYRKIGFLIITNNMYELLGARFKDKERSYEKHAVFQDERFLKRFREIAEAKVS